jgi:hypothetical protein
MQTIIKPHLISQFEIQFISELKIMSMCLRDFLELMDLNLANRAVTSVKGDRMNRMSCSVTKQDGSHIKSILKLRRSQSAKKVSFGGDEVIYEYSKPEEAQKQLMVWSQNLPVFSHFSQE